MILVKLKEPVINIIISIAELKTNSYEIIAAVLLNEPKKAYLASLISIYYYRNRGIN